MMRDIPEFAQGLLWAFTEEKPQKGGFLPSTLVRQRKQAL